MYERHEIGINGEEAACDYLKRLGYKIYCRNFRSYFGEIDIIAIDENEIVFVEVKTRTQKILVDPPKLLILIKNIIFIKLLNILFY